MWRSEWEWQSAMLLAKGKEKVLDWLTGLDWEKVLDWLTGLPQKQALLMLEQ
jgi:hypothetical protein